MPTEKKINARYQQKHDVEANWKQAVNFIPKAGEIIVYDADEIHNSVRIKIGDGHTPVNSLLFIEQSCAPTANLLGLLQPNDLKVEYSTQGTGWLCQVTDREGVQLARKYFTQGVPTEWTHYSIPFTTGTSDYITVNVRKAAEDVNYIPGEFAFDNFKIGLHGLTEPINLLKNGDFEARLTDWTVNDKFAQYCHVVNAGSSLGKTGLVLSIEVPDSSAKYATILEQTVSATPNTPYKFSMWTHNMAGSGTAQARVYFFDQNGTQIHYYTANAGSAFSTSFITGSDVTAIKVAIRGNLQYLADDLFLSLNVPQFKNGDFSNGTTNWDTSTTYSSSYVPEEIVTEGTNKYIRTRCDQIGPGNTSAAFIKQTHIYTEKNQTYTLEFDLKRLSESATWQDYMTIMEQDKFALMNENTIGTGEYPKFGGPWANVLHYDYILRCVIEKPEDVHFDLSHVGLLTNIVSALGSEVIVEGRNEDEWFHVARQEFDENIGWAETVPDKSKIVSCNDLQDSEFDAIRITLTFKNDSTMVDENFQPTKNFLKGIRLYGHSDISLPECELPMCQDYFGNVHCSNEVRAAKFVGDIDDGSLDWGSN